jgi:replicative DNA helicase
MANVELTLISNIVRDGDLSTLRRSGFNAAFLQTEEGREMFRWLSDAFTDVHTGGVVPSLDRVRRHFPEFDYCPSRDPIDALAKEVIDNNVKAGIRASVEEIDGLLDEGEDPQVILGAYLPQLRELSMQGSDSKHLLMSTAALGMREDYDRMQEAGGITGLPFPWAPLNKATAGMQPEDFIVIYARPKQMKTWVAIAIACHAYLCGYRVLVYSKEMSDRILARRAASIIAEIDYEELKSGQLSAADEKKFFNTLEGLSDWEKATSGGGRKAAMTFLSDRKLSSGSKGATVDILSAEAERFGADLIIVDGFYLMRDGRTNQRSREWKQVSNISSDLKNMAQTLAVPVIGTTQANRGASKTSGDDTDEVGYADAIGQDTDLLMRVFKARNLATGKPKLMFTFPGTRDAVLNPFVINAHPGKDFSLLQSTVDVNAFLKDKKDHDEDEARAEGGGGGAPATPAAAAFGPPGKSGPRKKVSPRIR